MMFEMSLSAKPDTKESLDRLLGDLGSLHIRNGVGFNYDTLEVSYIGKVDPVTAGMLLSLFDAIPEHSISVKQA